MYISIEDGGLSWNAGERGLFSQTCRGEGHVLSLCMPMKEKPIPKGQGIILVFVSTGYTRPVE